MVIDIKESTFDVKELQKLRNLEDKILCKACRCLKSTMKIIETLADLNKNLPKTDPAFATKTEAVHQQFQLIRQRLEAHIDTAELLAQRVQATLGLVGREYSTKSARVLMST
jgi:hypothetical protein